MPESTSGGDLPVQTKLTLFEEMLRIRRFENRVGELYAEGDVPGFMHLSNGHEASHAGIGVAKDAEDWWVPGGARVNGQALAAGLTMREVLAEIFGKETGSNSGKGGHMHVSNVDEQFYGSAATIGQGPNPAAGFALAQQQLGRDTGVVSVVGDGGTSRGTFHTALNLASVWDLPVVFVIENNRYALSFHTEERVEPKNLADRAENYGIPSRTIDGADVELVYNTIDDALQYVTSGNGPMVVEHKLHRLEGHYVGDKEEYRETDIESIREQYDPVSRYRDKLQQEGHLTDDEYESMIAEIDANVDDAVQFTDESDYPDPPAAYENLYNQPLYGGED